VMLLKPMFKNISVALYNIFSFIIIKYKFT
jgi:hypothetical protein